MPLLNPDSLFPRNTKMISDAFGNLLLLLLHHSGLLSVLRRGPLQDQQPRKGQGDPHPPQCYLGLTEDQLAQKCGGDKVGGGGGHSGSGGGRGVPEGFGEEGPHHSVAGEEQAAAQQPQWDVEPVARRGLARLSKFPLLSPRPEPSLANPLQVVCSEGQLGRRRRHGAQETRQQCIEDTGEHVDRNRGTYSF